MIKTLLRRLLGLVGIGIAPPPDPLELAIEQYCEFVVESLRAGYQHRFCYIVEGSVREYFVPYVGEPTIITEDCFIRPDFGARSKQFVVLKGAHVASSNRERGWGGWQHPFGHHEISFAWPDPDTMNEHERQYFAREVADKFDGRLPVYPDMIDRIEASLPGALDMLDTFI